MRYAFTVLCAVTWALWLGGLMGLFLTISALFAADRALGAGAGPVVFRQFDRYQLTLAAVALVATFALYVASRSRWVMGVFGLLAAATLGAAILPVAITPKMQALVRAGETHGPQFRRLHGQSMIVYAGETAALLLAGVLLPATINTALRPRAAEPPPTIADGGHDAGPQS